MDDYIKDEIIAKTGNELVAELYEEVLEYLNHTLFHIHGDRYENAADFAIGYLNDLQYSKDTESEKVCEACIEEAYSIFLRIVMNLSTFRGIPETILSVILAKFFQENFSYLPSPPDLLQASPS